MANFTVPPRILDYSSEEYNRWLSTALIRSFNSVLLGVKNYSPATFYGHTNSENINELIPVENERYKIQTRPVLSFEGDRNPCVFYDNCDLSKVPDKYWGLSIVCKPLQPENSELHIPLTSLLMSYYDMEKKCYIQSDAFINKRLFDVVENTKPYITQQEVFNYLLQLIKGKDVYFEKVNTVYKKLRRGEIVESRCFFYNIHLMKFGY